MVSTPPGKYKLSTGVNDTGDKYFAGVVDTAEQLITGDNREYLHEFSKKFKKAPIEYAWGTLIHEKNLKSKISCQTPFNGLVPASTKPPVNQKFSRKPPVILKIVPKAGHKCTQEKINQ
jgi:hypothetical protein